MRLILTMLLALPAWEPALAQTYSGPATVIDGDTLDMTGERIRLSGIDAPEARQSCQRNDEPWDCGKEAHALLASLVAGQSIECEQRDRDVYDRAVAVCRIRGRDLALVLVQAGLAVTLKNATQDYLDGEAIAKRFKQGMWGSSFELPADYRRAHPQQFVRATPPTVRRASSPRTAAPASVWFRNCAEARAAGAAPMYRGQPGYRPEMDGDGDGIACEPYRGKR